MRMAIKSWFSIKLKQSRFNHAIYKIDFCRVNYLPVFGCRVYFITLIRLVTSELPETSVYR